MKESEGPRERRAGVDSIDPLDEALRQIGADMLEEPVPERLRRVLRALAEPRQQTDAEGHRGSGDRR
ncbi:MAG TPA: hypothetical protein VFV80_14005 [Geminicoccaceae bacterium]|nr:hypothetical protein [Geminicoccaceae bacterium]